MFKIKSHLIPHLIAGLFLIGPPLVAVLFGVLSIPLPATIIIYLFAIILILTQFNFRSFNLKISKFNLLYVTYLIYFILAFLSYYKFSEFESPEFKLVSIVYRIVLPVFFIFISLMLSKNNNEIDIIKIDQVYFKLWTKASIIFILMFFLFKEAQPNARFILPGLNNPIWISRYLGAALVFTVLYYLKYNKKINFIYILILIISLFISNSRGPILASVFSTGLFFFNTKIKYKKFFIFLLLSFLIIYFTFFFSDYLYGRQGYSFIHRLNALSNAFEIFNFNGHGLSSFGRLIFNEDTNQYPHNIFVELIFEFGFIGFILGLSLLYLVYSCYSKSIIGYLTMYFFINAQFSGDIAGNTLLYISLVIAWQLKNNNIKSIHYN